MEPLSPNQEEDILQRVHRQFSPEALRIDQQNLYVDLDKVRGDAHPTQRIAKSILLADKPTCQVLAGHRGSGKSTELRWLKKELENKCYFTVLCDTREDVDPNDVDLLEVLIAIMRQLAKQLEAEEIKLAPGYFRGLWERIKALLDSEVNFEGIDLEAGMMKLSTVIKSSPDARLKLREKMEPDMGNWLHAANDLIGKAVLELRKKGWRGLVVLVDDLDKMVTRPHASAGCSTVEYLFVHRQAQLAAFDCYMVYTVPIQLAYSRLGPTLASLYGGSLPVLPMVKIQLPPPNRGTWEPGMQKFREMIEKRLSEAGVQERQVFADDQVRDDLIRMTGGQPTELMYLMREAMITEMPITPEAVERAVRERRKTYQRQLFAEDVEIIEHVRKDGKVQRTKSNDTILRDLLDNRVILQYVNDKEWYDVNPVIEDPPKQATSEPKPE